MAIIPLCSAVILNFGLMGIFGIRLSHLTALLTSIIIGVGVDFAVHYISAFRRKLKLSVDSSKLSVLTMDDVGYPILLDVVSNMGFAALLFSDLIPLNYMGGLMIFAMLSTSFGTLLLMGTTIEIFRKRINFK
jgi:predicted RND superfamily exporter protein